MRRLRLLIGLFLTCGFFAQPTTYIFSSSVIAGPPQSEVKVWVNTNSGVYHCPGTRWYGITKHGKYVDECTAIKEGDRPAYGRACGSECPSGSNITPASSRSSEENSPTTARQTGNPDAKVWVNTNSGVYHCPGTRWYGSTKHGEFMTQKKAQETGYRPAYGKPCQ